MNRQETDRLIAHLIDGASQVALGRRLEEIPPFDEDPDPIDLCIDAAIEAAQHGMARRSEEEFG